LGRVGVVESRGLRLKRESGAESGPTTGTRRFRSSSRLGITSPVLYEPSLVLPRTKSVTGHPPAGGKHGQQNTRVPRRPNLLVNVSTSFREHAACHQFVLALLLEDSPYQAVVAVTQRAAVAPTQRAHTSGEWVGRKSPPLTISLDSKKPGPRLSEVRSARLSIVRVRYSRTHSAPLPAVRPSLLLVVAPAE
jgi:hypothetical protein